MLFTMAIVLRDYRLDMSFVDQYSHHITAWIVVQGTCEGLVFLGAMYKMISELSELCRHGCNKMYWTSVGFARNENIISMSFCLLQFTATICRVTQAYQVERVLWTFMCYLLWIYLTLLFMAFRAFGPFIVMIKRMILGDIMRFAVIGVFVLASFTTVFFCLLDTEESVDTQLWSRISLAGAVATDLYGQMISGDVRFDGTVAELMINKDFLWLYYINVFLFSIIMCVMLLNLLIAMMGNTYNRIEERAETEWRLVFAQIIFFLEDEMSESDLRHMMKDDSEKYWVEIKGRNYLSVEEANPLWNTPDTDEVDSWLAHFDLDEDAVLDKGEVKRLVAMLQKKSVEDGLRQAEASPTNHRGSIGLSKFGLMTPRPNSPTDGLKNFGVKGTFSPRLNEPRPSLSFGVGLDHLQEHLPDPQADYSLVKMNSVREEKSDDTGRTYLESAPLLSPRPTAKDKDVVIKGSGRPKK